jgi:hypothetical protein
MNNIQNHYMNFYIENGTQIIRYTDSDMPIDYHPTPVDYQNYLIKCNIPISQEAVDYAHESLEKIVNT